MTPAWCCDGAGLGGERYIPVSSACGRSWHTTGRRPPARRPVSGRAGVNATYGSEIEHNGSDHGESSFRNSGFLKASYLELKADDVEDMRQRIVAFGVRVLEVPDPHLYFQAPGGQVFRLAGTNEDLSQYEGTEHGEQFAGGPFPVREPDAGPLNR
jgi:hypothetical protein